MSRAASPSRERTYGVARVTRDTIRTERPNRMWATDQTKAVTVEDGEVTVAPALPRAARVPAAVGPNAGCRIGGSR